MKILKTTLVLTIMLLLIPTLINAQENQLFWVHTDYVKPSMQNDYEKVSKDFVEACKKHDLKGADWATLRMDGGAYITIAPIEKMGDFDQNPLAPLAEKMGEKDFSNIFERFNKCYDRHTDNVIVLSSNLSYMPDGLTVNTPNQNYRKYHFFYVTPSTSKSVSGKIKAITDFYAKKGLKEHFRIYRSGFGAPEEFYLAVLSAKDAQDYLKTSGEAEAQYGDEGKKLFDDLFASVTRYETKEGAMRPDLGYTAKQ